MTFIPRVLSVVVVGLPLALIAADGPPPPSPVTAAALAAPNYSTEQQIAVARARQSQAHPLWKNLSTAAQAERLLMFGRRMIVASSAGDPAAASSAGFQGNLNLITGPSGNAIELQRQADCSLSSSYGSYTLNLMNPNIQVLSTTARYEKVLHDAAGLATQAGAFAHGCAEATLGIGSRRGFYLGRTSQSLYLFAYTGYSFVAGTNILSYYSVDVATQKVHSFNTDTSLPTIYGMAAGDLDGDGLADIVGLDQSSGSVSVWLSHADGSLSAPRRYSTGGSGARAAVLADFDGDGKVDLVAATTVAAGAGTQEAIAFLHGRGDGTFDAAQTINIATPTQGASRQVVNLVAVDLRGTGHLDIVGSNGLVLLNDGHGHFTQAAFAFAPMSATSSWGPNLATGDFNEDGKQDVAVNNGASVQIYLGRGDGTFDTGKAYASNDSVGYLTASDLDGDGHTDLYVGLANGGFFGGDQFGVNRAYVLLGRGDGSFAGAPVLPFVYNGHNLVDLDGDGKLDAVGVNSDLSFTTYLGDGHGAFTAHATLATTPLRLGTETFVLPNIDSFDLADIDGDGKLDLVFVARNFVARNRLSDFNSPGILFARGDGQGGFATPTFLPAPSFVPAGDFDYNVILTNIRLADVNRDGKADLVYAYASTAYNTRIRTVGTAVQLGNGDGTFQPPKVLPFYSRTDNGNGFDLSSEVQQFVDLNGDGKLDLLLVTQTSTRDATLSTLRANVQVALGAGDGTFATPVTVNGPEIVGRSYREPQPAAIVVADMNGDGIVDLVMLGSSSGYNMQAAIALGNGDGTFKAPDRTTFSAQALGGDQQLAVADFNGDGKLDVFIANPFGATGIAYGRGDGTLAPLGTATAATFNLKVNLPTGGAVRVLELNSDGKPDVLVGATLLLSQSVAAATAPAFSLAATSSAGTVKAGQSVQTTLTLTSADGYASDVALSCAGLPAGASCSFAPATVAVRGNTASTTLTLATTAAAGIVPAGGVDPRVPGSALLAMFAVAALWRRRERMALVRRVRLPFLLALGGAALCACGGGGTAGGDGAGNGPVGSATPAGSYTVVVTATDGTVNRTFNYTLQVN